MLDNVLKHQECEKRNILSHILLYITLQILYYVFLSHFTVLELGGVSVHSFLY